VTATETHDTPSDADELAAKLSVAVAEAFIAFTTAGQMEREDLYALTMSGLGGCTRQAAYRVAKAEPSEELVFGEMREADIGTMIHAGLLPHLAEILGGAEEIDVVTRAAGLVIKGRTDLYVESLALVGDLKTTGTYSFGTIGVDAVPRHRMQVAGYAYGLLQSGKPVRWIAWVYLDRSSGKERIIVEPWTDELAAMVEQRCEEIAMYAADPTAAPRDERGPGLCVWCDGCSWLRACWGPDAEPGAVGAQRILAQDHDGVKRALEFYDEARARADAAEAEKEFARAMFEGYTPGRYGEFSFRYSKPGKTVDKDAAVEILKQAGITVPEKTTKKKLIVQRVDPNS
jgi:hypothetical protein